MADLGKAGARTGAVGKRKPAFAKWSRKFLTELAATSNVTASAKRAGVAVSTVYEARRMNPEFHRAWQDALCEGYDHLEMDLLRRLRDGELKPAKDAKRGVRAYDNATAFRLLAAHRATAAQARAIRDNVDADAILASIDAKLDRMRERAMKRANVVDHDPITDDEK